MPNAREPSGAAWDAPLAAAPLVFVDLEMTGLDARDDRVVEVCAERWVGAARVASVCTLVRPEPFRTGNEAIHRIPEEALRTAPTFAEIWPALREVLGGAVLVAHGARWDVRFLEAELARMGEPGPFEFSVFHLDTLELSRRAEARPSHALHALSRDLGLEVSALHRAEADVSALRAVFARVSELLGARTPRDLWHVRIGQGHARPEIVAALVDACARRKPVRIRYRPSGKAPTELVLVVTSVATEHEPPTVHAYETASRGRRVLRADRVLSVTPVD